MNARSEAPTAAKAEPRVPNERAGQALGGDDERDISGRLMLSVAVGIITALFALELATRPNVHTDFEVLWRAARLWADLAAVYRDGASFSCGRRAFAA